MTADPPRMPKRPRSRKKPAFAPTLPALAEDGGPKEKPRLLVVQGNGVYTSNGVWAKVVETALQALAVTQSLGDLPKEDDGDDEFCRSVMYNIGWEPDELAENIGFASGLRIVSEDDVVCKEPGFGYICLRVFEGALDMTSEAAHQEAGWWFHQEFLSDTETVYYFLAEAPPPPNSEL